MTSINEKQLSSITNWRNAGIVLTGLGLGATLLSRRLPQLTWPHPLAVKWIGPGLAGTGALLAIVTQAQIWLTPTQTGQKGVPKEKEEEVEDKIVDDVEFLFNFNTCKIYTKRSFNFAEVLDGGQDTRLAGGKKILERPPIPKRLIQGDFFLPPLSMSVEDYLVDLCTTARCFPSVTWLDPVSQMTNLKANFAAANGDTAFDQLSEKAIQALSINDEADWNILRNQYVLEEEDSLTILAKDVDAALVKKEGQQQPTKTAEELTAEASAFSREEFLKRNALDGDVTWLADSINPVAAVEKLRLLFALQVGSCSFEKMDEEQKASCQVLSILNANQWNELHKQLNTTRENLKEGVVDALKKRQPAVINRMALKLANIEVRTVLKARWDEMKFFDALEQDGDLVWKAMNVGSQSNATGYIASNWHDRAMKETEEWSLTRIVEEQPNLLAMGVLKKADVEERFEESKANIFQTVLKQMSETCSPDAKLFRKCPWLVPDQMNPHITKLRANLKQADKNEGTIKKAKDDFANGALDVALELLTEEI